MSKLNQKIARAHALGVHVIKRLSEPLFYGTRLSKYDVIVEAEGSFGLRDLALTKRQAANLAHAISISKKYKVEVIRDN